MSGARFQARSLPACVGTLACAAFLSTASTAIAEEFLDRHPAVAEAIALFEIWTEEQLTYQQIPGLAIGILYEDELIWSRGFGVADLNTESPVEVDTLFRAGSISKLFTATAILQLRDEGLLRLDDPVEQHLPEFDLETPFPEEPPVTLRHLLTHTAGIPREAAFPYWTDHEFPSAEELLEALPGQQMVFPPGGTYKYSNLGMALLGQIVARLSGEPHAEYVQRRILKPLGMSSSTFTPGPEQFARMATAYLRYYPGERREVFEYYETEGMAPAANLVTSISDLARFAALHLGGDSAPAEGAVLAPSTIREMQRPHFVYPSWRGGRGLGFAVSRRDDETIVAHGGWIGGHRGQLMLVPSYDIAIIVLLNADDGSPSQFAYEAWDVVGAAIVESTKPPPVATVADPGWERYFGTYTDPWGWEWQVLVLDGELVLYSHDYPPADDADAGVTRLTPVANHTFRMPDGELVVFELGDDGSVQRIKRRSDYLFPVDSDR
jgi:CubicO group peptidase (beta-lactamase class C family)